ncbi:ester cyclase [Streptomyces sp. ISL-99]|uniref:ester cyclase n=1 Tax=Streptomyces sp. ISL-99 TaxID=2819193 RepID=UPI001BE833CC|nr:ester cyclase [Streptomyces sp. ISL-99]MBT2524616.1 ester cyclase [Streptomyces sp. ISL-99]
MKFVQIIDYKTERSEDMNQLLDRWAEQTKGKRTATHNIVGNDRSEKNHYVEIVEFPSYEEAMKNSQLPETDRTFQEMVALCDGMPSFTDLDVVRDEQLNKDLCNRFFDEIAVAGNLDAIDEVFAADYRDHDIFKEEESTVGADVIRSDLTGWRDGFDFRFTIDKQVAEGDEVVTLWTWTGTHKGEFMGVAPTGKKCTMTGTTVFSCHDGKIQEGWWHMDAMSLMRQLGAMR